MLRQTLSARLDPTLENRQEIRLDSERVDFTDSEGTLREIIDESLGFMPPELAREFEAVAGTPFLSLTSRGRSDLLYYNLIDHVVAIPESARFEVYLNATLSRKTQETLEALLALMQSGNLLVLNKTGRRDYYCIRQPDGTQIIRVFPDRVELMLGDIAATASDNDQQTYKGRRDLYISIITALHEQRPLMPQYNFPISEYLFFLDLNQDTKSLVAPNVDLAGLVRQFIEVVGGKQDIEEITSPLKGRAQRQLRRDLLDESQFRYILDSDGRVLVGFNLPLDTESIEKAARPLVLTAVTDSEGKLQYRGLGGDIPEQIMRRSTEYPGSGIRVNKTPIASSGLLAETEFKGIKLSLGERFAETEQVYHQGRVRRIKMLYTPLLAEGRPLLDLGSAVIKFYPRDHYTEEELLIAAQAAQSIYSNMLFLAKIGGKREGSLLPRREILEGIRFVDEVATAILYQRILEQHKTRNRSLVVDKKEILREQPEVLSALGFNEYFRQGSMLRVALPYLEEQVKRIR